VILDNDPLTVKTENILTIGVVETLKEGTTVYQRSTPR
jgi:predicted amidohydrolase YtcJ